MARSLCGQLQTDLRTLSNAATTANYKPVKEAAECGLLKLKTILTSDVKVSKDGNADKPLYKLLKQNCGSLLQPFLLGLDTKHAAIMASAFMSIQRILSHGIIDTSSANNIMSALLAISENSNLQRSIGFSIPFLSGRQTSAALSMMSDDGTDHDLSDDNIHNRVVNSSSTTLNAKYNDPVRLLQIILILISTTNSLKEKPLATALSLCFKYKNTLEATVKTTASATIRQNCLSIFERVKQEDEQTKGKSISKHKSLSILNEKDESAGHEQDSVINQIIMNQLFPAAKDAFQLFRDLVNLVMKRPCLWLKNVQHESGDMQAYAIELIEHIVGNFPQIFKGVGFWRVRLVKRVFEGSRE